MMNTFKLGLRNGMSVQQYGAELRRRRVNAMMSHARWAGRHLASFTLLSKDFNLINARGKLSDTVMSHSLLAHPYCVNPILVPYALKVAKEKLNGRTNRPAQS